MFQCGCTSDVAEHDEAQKHVSEPHKSQQESNAEDDLIMYESAKEYMDRISTQLNNMEERKRKSVSKTPQQPTSAHASPSKNNENDQVKVIDTVFRNPSNRNNTSDIFPSLKHTESESTQSTIGLSDDELSTVSTSESDAEDPSDMPKPVLVSILRRKEKLGAIEIAPRGVSVTFCPKTVFPDPNQPKKRKRVRRIKSKARFESYESQVEPRRLQRRAQQRQHPYITDDFRSPSSDFLQQTESFYVFR